MLHIDVKQKNAERCKLLDFLALIARSRANDPAALSGSCFLLRNEIKRILATTGGSIFGRKII